MSSSFSLILSNGNTDYDYSEDPVEEAGGDGPDPQNPDTETSDVQETGSIHTRATRAEISSNQDYLEKPAGRARTRTRAAAFVLTDRENALCAELALYGDDGDQLGELLARRLVVDFGEIRCRERMLAMPQRIERAAKTGKPIASKAGYLRTWIEQGYRVPTEIHDRERQQARKAQADDAAAAAQREAQAAKMREDQERAANDALLAALPPLVLAKIEQLAKAELPPLLRRTTTGAMMRAKVASVARKFDAEGRWYDAVDHDAAAHGGDMSRASVRCAGCTQIRDFQTSRVIDAQAATA